MQDNALPKKKRQILVVDDQAVNRKLLKRILGESYDVSEAENGEAALDFLRRYGGTLSAVLLDLVMPGLDGFGVLKAMQSSALRARVPVIVVSQADKTDTESKALQLGARDFLSKPYNPEVIRQRLANLIELYESRSCIDRIERDALTGLYNKDAFCRRAEAILEENPDTPYLLVAADIERFKLVNECFGTEPGDRLLCFVAECLRRETAAANGLLARHNADHYVALVPCKKDDEASLLQNLIDASTRSLSDYPLHMRITLKFGVYPVTNHSAAVSLLCDRAILAAESIKGQYNSAYAYYDDSIRQKLLREQQITNEMKTALSEGQFQVYLQPKYDLQCEQIAGAEALVRWIHPELGFMNPNDFIPLFERNGFITELDKFVWDRTCALIAEWSAHGDKFVPVSVNVSRKDIFQESLPEHFMGLMQKYHLDPSRLHLEITESAYTKSADQLIAVVSKLKSLGFAIEMDDFGSGYSSLNMLSELPLDILKLDMRFIQKETAKNSSRNILSFVISLAKWMNLLVVAEGVETHEQIELLRNMDCNYVQGYYYAKPMPAAAFTELLYSSEIAVPLEVGLKDWSAGSLSIHEKAGGKVMLIVDDVALNRAILAEYFEDIYTVMEADNGQVALDYINAHRERIAVILLDLVMPVMDGFQLLQKLEANPLYREIPVIVTSQAGDTCEERAFELGATDFLPKPYNRDIALHRVQNSVAHAAVQKLRQENERLTARLKLSPAPRLPAYNVSELPEEEKSNASDSNA